MRLDPISERFRLRVEDRDEALRLIGGYAARRGKVIENSESKVVFRVGSPLLFLLLGTFHERGRRSVPVKVTVTALRDPTTPWLYVTMESQERGFFVRARWLVAAFYGYFRDLYAELQEATRPRNVGRRSS